MIITICCFPAVLRHSKDQKEKGKGQKGKGNKGKKKKRTKIPTAVNPEHTSSGHTSPGHTPSGHTSSGHTSSGHTSSGHTSSGHRSSGHTSEFPAGHTHQTSERVTEDPCSSSHKGYCIHGLCKYMADLREPVCMCNKGYDGERCGILLLPTTNKEDSGRAEVVQTVLVIIAVVLSSVSCLAILLMACTHYRTHKNFCLPILALAEKQQLTENHTMYITVVTQQ
nr:probetacellulin-like [Salvelinus alpinus]